MIPLSSPSTPIDASGPVSQAFRELGITTFLGAVEWTYRLPYGRNTDRANYMLIFQERRGTCSTKHAALAALAAENGIKVELRVAICKLDATLNPKVIPLLEKLGIDFFPEAHCYLEDHGQVIDITFPEQQPTMKAEILEAYTIQPDQIGSYKCALHKTYLQKWLQKQPCGRLFTLEQIWQLREEWIGSLSNSNSKK